MATIEDPAGTRRRPLRHAVVIGGSIAGLLAARVLAGHFERVTVVERDTLSSTPEPRKGVPQGQHVHAVLVRGHRIIEHLLPGLTGELRAAGATLLNGGHDLAWHQAGGWRVRHDSDLAFLSMTRPLLETRIAARVRALANVNVLDGARLHGLQGGHQRGVTGVHVRRCGAAGPIESIAADLVVDSSGRGSATPQLLGGLGFDAPEAELLPARVAYASRLFRQPDRDHGWRALIVGGAPGRRNGLIFPVEGGHWLVTLVGFFDEPMPQDHDAFLAFARSLPVPDVHQAIRAAEPLSGIAGFRFAGSLRRSYEQLARFPAGLVVTGDAVCSFNPVYGQGMTVSAIEVELLGQMLGEVRREGGLDPDFGRRWFRRIAPVVEAAWGGVALEDLRFPELAHQRPIHLGALQWYMGRVNRATHRSARVTDQFYRVMNFLDPPRALFRPRMLAEVLLGGSPGLRARATGPDAPSRPQPSMLAPS
jgi:2-polyprenyl-6-methoxyphenol hydroxylase-like FAD-dependent oxidoreductase